MKKEITTTSRQEIIQKLIDFINMNETALQEYKVTAGFDGFVDIIARVIKTKKKNEVSTFRRKKEFGNYIIEKEGSSFSLELEEQSARIGGNMPIMANTMARLGATVNCIGALGYPNIHPVFENLNPRCRLYSFANPGTATALEFDDGKIIIAQMGELNQVEWNHVKKVIGLDTIIPIFQQSDLLCLVNWSEVMMSTDIWKGLLEEVFPRLEVKDKKQFAFFDLSDCSKRNNESIMEALELINEFSKYTRVTLGLNKNEADGIYNTLFNKKPKKTLSATGEKIFEKLNIETLILHSSKEAVAINGEEALSSESFFIKQPAISTGAGDNFNAGFCAARLLNADVESSLAFAHAVSGSFVTTGISPEMITVREFLQGEREK
jgi:sugar/nucleoside kinase (ribokinase family)